MGVYENSITEPGTSYAVLRSRCALGDACPYLPPRARTTAGPVPPYERTPAETTRPRWVRVRASERERANERTNEREREGRRGSVRVAYVNARPTSEREKRKEEGERFFCVLFW